MTNDIDRQVARDHGLIRAEAGGGRTLLTRTIAVEAPVALEVNGLGYAVLMTSPADLDDLVTGFARSERLIEHAADILEIEPIDHPAGRIMRMTLDAQHLDRVIDRVRHRVSESGCGLCGIENLEQAIRPLPPVTATSRAGNPAIFRALEAIAAWQTLNRATGAVHAAAMCAADGAVRLVREDVGRHNAFDKLIGAVMRGGLAWDGGFALLTSRCSYELVEKAVLGGCPMLVTVSAPTSLALDRAREAGLPLRTLARRDALLES